jgi:hypothetical protein
MEEIKQPNIEIESNKLEKWNEFLKSNYNLPDRIRLVDIEAKDNHYFKYILIFIGLLAISVVIFYLGTENKFISDINCGNATLSCNNSCASLPNIPSCPTIPSCPSCSLFCGNITINPVVYTNSS